MYRLYALIFCASFLIVINTAQSQSLDSIPTSNQRLKIISWNIYMLPPFIKNTGKIARAKKIGEQLSVENVDVIVFQEAFHGGARKKIRERLQKNFPYAVGPANHSPFSLKANSGIWIFSKYPIVNQASIVFKSCYGIDALSKKGALLVELEVNGKKIQVVGTHLQNSGGAELKQLQCREIFEKLLIKHEKTGVPQIICGDFNIDKQSQYYDEMLVNLEAKDGLLTGEQLYSFDRLTNDLQSESGQKRDLIDYILLRNNKTKCQFISSIIKPFKSKWHKDHHDLSDHYPLVTEIMISSATEPTSLVQK